MATTETPLAGPGTLDTEPIETCDGDVVLAVDARRTAQRYMVGGLLVPFFWVVNIWLFNKHFFRGDPRIRKYLRLSAIGCWVYFFILFSWMLTYWIGGPELLGQGTYDSLDVTRVDLASAGLSAGG